MYEERKKLKPKSRVYFPKKGLVPGDVENEDRIKKH